MLKTFKMWALDPDTDSDSDGPPPESGGWTLDEDVPPDPGPCVASAASTKSAAKRRGRPPKKIIEVSNPLSGPLASASSGGRTDKLVPLVFRGSFLSLASFACGISA